MHMEYEERIRISREKDEGRGQDLVHQRTSQAKHEVKIWRFICKEVVKTMKPVEGNIKY